MSFLDMEIKPEYRSRLDNVMKDFYIPVLKQAVLYKRAVGFFSSSALLEMSAGLCGLVKNGGKIQLIASPRLSAEDIEAINEGLRRRDEVIEEVLIRELTTPTGPQEAARLNLLSNLIASGVLEIKIAFLETDNMVGMFHEKMGLMYDAHNNIIAFSGSMNESFNAFRQNYEAIDVFTSWTRDEDRVLAKQSAFNAMWNDYEPSICVREFPQVSDLIVRKYLVDKTLDLNLDDSIDVERIPKKQKNEEQDNMPAAPRVPSFVKMRPYQLDAIASWEEHNFQGIFDMATGTGKTYTGLAAVSHLFSYNKNRLGVIIVCPYQHLVEQWKEDIIAFGMKPIVCYSASKQKNWKERLKTAVTGFNIKVIDHFCAITTNATFSGDFFQEQLSKLKKDVLLVADEAHNFGAENLSQLLPQNIRYRLALSATIERHGDPEGTQRIFKYFGDKCIEYSLKQAIDNDMLTKYFYYPVPVSLDQDELESYISYTEKISASLAKHPRDKKLVLSSYEKTLLIQRARIVAGAKSKVDVLREQIEPYRKQSNILVYCGATTYVDDRMEHGESGELRQIEKVVDVLGNELDMQVSPFTSQENAATREQLKIAFQSGNPLQALVAIRCLDEGVNIPSIKTAFILASSTNPKEYVQRRGRVLRKYPGKTKADIFDFITLPIPLSEVDNYSPAVVQAVAGLAKREIKRMLEFAEISENPSAVDALILDIREAYGIQDLDEGDVVDEFID